MDKVKCPYASKCYDSTCRHKRAHKPYESDECVDFYCSRAWDLTKGDERYDGVICVPYVSKNKKGVKKNE